MLWDWAIPHCASRATTGNYAQVIRQWRILRRRASLERFESSSAVAKAHVNLLSYGLLHPQVFTVADSVIDPNIDRLAGTLRLILTNPPFGDNKYDSPEGIRRTAQVLPLASEHLN